MRGDAHPTVRDHASHSSAASSIENDASESIPIMKKKKISMHESRGKLELLLSDEVVVQAGAICFSYFLENFSYYLFIT